MRFVCLFIALTMIYRICQAGVRLRGLCTVGGHLLWGPPFTLDASSCVTRMASDGRRQCLGGGVLLPVHTASSWDGPALGRGRENCFLTLWKHAWRQIILKRLDEGIAKQKQKHQKKTLGRAVAVRLESDGWVWELFGRHVVITAGLRGYGGGVSEEERRHVNGGVALRSVVIQHFISLLFIGH